MKDRVVQFPHRYKAVPVPGTTDTYDLIAVPGEVTAEGTELSKGNLLADPTAIALGLMGDPTINDALAYLARNNLHWWQRQQLISPITLAAAKVRNACSGTSGDYWYHSTEITVTDKDISLINPSRILVSASSVDLAVLNSAIKGKYFIKGKGTSEYSAPCYYMEPDAPDIYREGTSSSAIVYTTDRKCILAEVLGDVEYLYSLEEDAYPKGGVVAGYEYKYLGIPMAQLPRAPRVQTGFYVGTGASGVDNPNRLTFSFEPELVIVTNATNGYGLIGGNSSYFGWDNSFIYTRGQRSAPTYTSSTGTTAFYAHGTTLTWYSSKDAAHQCNNGYTKYNYIAIGNGEV